MKKVRLLLFDLDGTLVDSRLDIANGVNFTLKKLGIPALDNEKIYSFVGDGAWELMERSINGKFIDVSLALKIFREYYAEHLTDNTYLYPNVNEILNYYSDKQKAVVTNKYTSYSIAILKKFDAAKYFVKILGSDSVERIKPDPMPLMKIMTDLNIEPSETVMIGDSKNDIIAARSAGTISCAVGYGLEKKEVLIKENPDYYISDLSELKKYFN